MPGFGALPFGVPICMDFISAVEEILRYGDGVTAVVELKLTPRRYTVRHILACSTVTVYCTVHAEKEKRKKMEEVYILYICMYTV